MGEQQKPIREGLSFRFGGYTSVESHRNGTCMHISLVQKIQISSEDSSRLIYHQRQPFLPPTLLHPSSLLPTPPTLTYIHIH